jgi:hypothetical protein
MKNGEKISGGMQDQITSSFATEGEPGLLLTTRITHSSGCEKKLVYSGLMEPNTRFGYTTFATLLQSRA